MQAITPSPTQAQFHAAINAASGRWLSACLGITRDQALAEDCVQEALVTAWAKRDQFRGDSVLTTWIHRIAVNAALQALRQRNRRVFVLIDVDMADESRGPDEVCDLDQFGGDLDEAMSALSDLERVCFVLKHLEQWRLAEIASHLDIGVGPVKQALFRALKKLRAALPADGNQ